MKAQKGFYWLLCVTQFPSSFCKYEVNYLVGAFYGHAWNLMLSQNFLCGYVFELCGATAGDVYYEKLNATYFAEVELADKPGDVAENNYLDVQYDLSNPQANPATYAILWISDIELDLTYTEGSSTECNDLACCHANTTTTDTSL